MKSSLKIAILSLLFAFSVEKPLQAALNPSDIALTLAGCTIMGGIAGYLISDKNSNSTEKKQDIADGCSAGFLVGLLTSALIVDVHSPRTYLPYATTYSHYPYTTVRTTHYYKRPAPYYPSPFWHHLRFV